MTYFEKQIMGGMDISKRSLSLCKEYIIDYKLLKRQAVLDYYNEDVDTRDFDEVDRIIRLSNYMIAIYNERIIIISTHLKAYELEVINRLV
jgi:hypothetical protein